MTRSLVIGIGNPLRGDDGLGQAVVEKLSASGLDADALAVHQLTPELAEPISSAGTVVFVDAAHDEPPGKVNCSRIAPALGDDDPALSHHLGPATVLSLAEKLYGHCPAAYIVTTGGDQFELGASLSPPVRLAVPEVLRVVQHLLQNGTENRTNGTPSANFSETPILD
ncbi:MAG: hydrogenase maturation protease [Gemmataceae bacterium]|nr:hydrogenase maturation protease [Gemmataceae bacterium]